MQPMAKSRKPKPTDNDKQGKKYPSREKTRYVGIPIELHAALERYAQSKSTEDDKKSISWAARVAVRKFLVDVGLWPPPQQRAE